jgi:hypothetical protein
MWTHSTFGRARGARQMFRSLDDGGNTRLSEAPEHALLPAPTSAGPVTLVLSKTIVTGPAGSVYRCGAGRGNCVARTQHTPPGGERTCGDARPRVSSRRGGPVWLPWSTAAGGEWTTESKVCFRPAKTPRSLRSAAWPPDRSARPRPGRRWRAPSAGDARDALRSHRSHGAPLCCRVPIRALSDLPRAPCAL